MPSHRACSGCGAPAAFGAWCVECCQERDGVNLLIFPGPGVPPRTDTDLDAAVDRALGRG